MAKKTNDQMAAYAEAATSGLYAKRSGLVGKYDNVRLYWEDEITRAFLQPYLAKLADDCRNSMRRMRIMDLGCGSADGFELLAGLRRREASLHETKIDLLPPDIIGQYKGVDLSPELLDQAHEAHGRNPKMVFEQADFHDGLPLGDDEEPFDLYFASYGTWSHNNEDETAIQLLTEIAEATTDYAVVVCDWLGRYSYEWQELWTNDLSEHQNMDYVVSYIYEEEEREAKRDQLEHLKLRLMSRPELDAILAEASKRSGVKIEPSCVFDRSVMCGRHLDTREYNAYAQPMRQALNSLHESNTRTDLQDLIFDYVPKQGFATINQQFEYIQVCWNALIEHTDCLLNSYEPGEARFVHECPCIPGSYPSVLQELMKRMERLIAGAGWLDTGLPRENILEPQLGYALRTLIMSLQKGMGCGHGFAVVLEIEK